MALANFWEATLIQRFGSGGEKMLNNFFFTSLDAGANSEDLYTGMTAPGELIDSINAIQADIVKNDSLRIINLGLLTDFLEQGVPGEGSGSSESSLPPHSAVNYALKLNTRAVRPGSKRFSGVPEDAQTNGVISDAAYIVSIAALEIKLSDVVASGSATFTPVVIKRIRIEPDVDHPNVRYRLPETDGELVFGTVTAALVNLLVSHQVSRGNGR